MRFQALFVLAASIASAMSDAVTVEADINQKIGPQTTTLLNDVNGYPASGLAGAFAIHEDCLGLIATYNNATNDVKSSSSFSEADGTTILTDYQNLIPTISGTLKAIGAQAPAWTNIPGGQVFVLSDLKGLNSSTIDFINALLATSPADLVPAFTSIETQIVGEFNSAIAAYSV